MDVQAGDLIFCHGGGLVAKAIRFGEWLRFRGGANFNHVAIAYAPTADGNDWYVIQAEGRGVTSTGTLGELLTSGAVLIAHAPTEVRRGDVVRFALEQVGRKYGFVTIASIVVTILLPAFINVMLPNTWICSAVAAESWRFGGWLHNWDDIYQVNPAELYEAVTC